MTDVTHSDQTERRTTVPGNRIVFGGIAAIVVILATAAAVLFASLPDANAFNARVERIFVDIHARCSPNTLSVHALYQRRGGIDINPFRSNHAATPASGSG